MFMEVVVLMVVENAIPRFFEWIGPASLTWLVVVSALVGVCVVISLLISGVKKGPYGAMRFIGTVLAQSVKDILNVSYRRVWALSVITFREAIRRKVIIGFLVFLLIVLFAGMFLDPTSRHPVQLYVEFIFSTTSYIVVLLMLLLTAFSLPGDIQRKTIHTIVTKPVRISEIVLGRILGFLGIGTMLLLCMGVVSYGFVVRSQNHTHALLAEDLVTISGVDDKSPARQGKTNMVREHTHDVYIESGEEDVQVTPRNDHSHKVTVHKNGDQTRYTLSGPTEMFHARVPVYGMLRFRDVMGIDTKKGVNVGDEWEYRSFIAGGTPASAIWLFHDISKERFPNGLPLEMVLEAFRTYKGKIDKRIMGALALRNPATGLTVEVRLFETVENEPAKYFIPVQIKPTTHAAVVLSNAATPSGGLVKFPPEKDRAYAAADKSEFNLFADLVAPKATIYKENTPIELRNALEIWVQCLDPGQYLGAAQSDLYIRASNSSFTWNFIKGYFGLWFQMALVVGFGVMFSTFLSTPVTLFVTLFMILGSFFHKFLLDLGNGAVLGGGPLEAAIRLFTQNNLTSELDMNVVQNIIATMGDSVFQGFMWLVAHAMPSFTRFDTSSFVARGFSIPESWVIINFLYVLAFLVPLYILGYLFLKLREIER